MEIYLLRHTAVAVAGHCYGHHDVALADTFAAEAVAVRAKLPAAGADCVYSSPSSRCQALAQQFGPAPEWDERLRELHFGTWENQPWDALPPAELNPWMADYVHTAPPGGETYGQLQARAVAFLEELVARPGLNTAFVVTHGGVVRALLAHVLGLPLANAFQVNVDFGSVTQLSWAAGRWQARGVNR
ncbi:alpha-ribazole phosphatase [Hymenobacter antarcticus]|uniref:Alpha-ribazole phosphatase n=1 Tax=Hymenobacter antarcticus TaxID=486270 RepID=A0ABP7PQ52_9BACT